MGMAASQARLLTITARIHDVEYEAQSIQNAKIQLATQEDAVYREYNEALDATTMTLLAMDSAGNKNPIAANFNNLCSRYKAQPASDACFALRAKDGKLIVEDEIAKAYNQSGNSFSTPYAFAVTMLGGELKEPVRLQDAEERVYEQCKNNEGNDNALVKLHTKLEQLCEKYGDKDSNIYSLRNNIINSEDYPNDKDKDLKEYEETLKKYQAALYRNHAGEVFKESLKPDITLDSGDKVSSDLYDNYDIEEDFNSDLFNYFINIYQQIQACGGCVSINFYNGSLTNNSAADNSEWLQAMVQSGQITIESVKLDKNTNEVIMETTSPSSDSVISYTPTSTIDKTALAKAEAKYEHDMKLIDKKDKQFDLSLSKLETERTALTTEYDSIKKVISDNIDRTFGIFS